MNDDQILLRLIQSHKQIEIFDYSKAVDWAIDLIREGKETENILMLASFSEPVDRFEIRPYVTNVLNDLGLDELDCKSAFFAETHYRLNEILNDREIRKNLRSLYQLCVDNDYESELMNFYLIYHGWDELEEIGVNYYFEEADLNNIDEILKTEARKWIGKYVEGKEFEEVRQTPSREKASALTTEFSKTAGLDRGDTIDNLLIKLWSWLKRKGK